MNRTSSRARVAGGLLLASCLLPVSIAAQVVQSERATVSQTVDGTVITIDYGRPRVKDRGEPFGDIVHIGDHRWTPGADWASTITSNRPFELNGHRVPAGTWSMWIDLEKEGWTFILDPKDSIFHTAPPEDSDEQIRFALERRQGPLFIESMLFWVPETRISGFDLLLSWGRTEIPFDVRVEPTFRTEVAKAEGTPLLGTYEFKWVDPPDPEEGGRQTLPFDVSWSGNHLLVESIRMEDGGPYRAWLLPRGEDYYRLGELKNGAVFDIEVDMTLETVRGPGGEVLGFDLRWEDDSLMAEIRRR